MKIFLYLLSLITFSIFIACGEGSKNETIDQKSETHEDKDKMGNEMDNTTRSSGDTIHRGEFESDTLKEHSTHHNK